MYLVSGFVIVFHLWPTAVLSSQCPQKEQVVMTLKKKRKEKKWCWLKQVMVTVLILKFSGPILFKILS